MALSGSLSNPFKTGYRIQIDWSATQNVGANTSTITANFYLISTGSGYNINASAAKALSIVIDGTTYSYSVNVTVASGQTKLLATATHTLAHNADGTRSFAISGSLGIAVTLSGTYYGTVSIAAVGFALNTIPRTSNPTVSAASVVMGNAIAIYTNRASTAFTHNLSYSIGGNVGAIATGVVDGYTWTPPTSLATLLPSSASGICYVVCDTYNGGTYIGSQTTYFTILVPASIVPTISNVVLSEAVSGIFAKFAGYVQYASKVSGTVTAAGALGSTISSYSTTVLGLVYPGATFTSGFLTSSGTVSVVTTVTDSRGRQASLTKTIVVLEYANPAIATFSVQRCTAGGTPNEDGTSLYANMKFTMASVNSKNDKTWKIEYRLSGSGSWITLSTGNVYTYDAVYTELTSKFSIDNAYEIRLTLTDFFGSVNTVVNMPTAFTLLDFSASGKGFAIGQVSTRDAFEIGMPAVFKSPVSGLGLLDFVHPVGSIFETTSSNFDRVEKVQAFFGGTWEIFGAGRVLVGVDSTQAEFSLIEGYAGEKTHTLLRTELPDHYHYIYAGTPGGGVQFPAWTSIVPSGSNANAPAGGGYITGGLANEIGVSHNNLQPYINIYRYRRIA